MKIASVQSSTRITDAAQIFEKKLQRLKNAVLVKRPILTKILEKKGGRKLYEYAKEYMHVNLNAPIQSRQDEFISSLKNEVASTLGNEIAESAARQLMAHYCVSTADHMGPICHPFFVNSNLLTAAPFVESRDSALNNIIVLACSNVSLNNSSFPRGLLFHTGDRDGFQMRRLSFLPSNAHASPVYRFRSYTADDVQKIKKTLKDIKESSNLSSKHEDKIAQIIDTIYSKPVILDCPTYAQQVIKTNCDLWKKFFAPTKVAAPNLIYVEYESLVMRLIIEHHLTQDTIINHFLFDPQYAPLINSYFEGIFGSFSRNEASGTYLFWALPKNANRALQLWRHGNFLVSKEGEYKVELTPEALKNAMEAGEIFPGIMLNFVVVAFYYGLKCLGGFNQVNYLTFMKNAYIKMNADLGNYKSIEACARAQTKEIADGLTIAFLQDAQKRTVLATGLDLILYGEEHTWPQFIEDSKNISLEDAFNPLLPEIYRITYLEDEWDPELAAITDQEIMEHTGFNAKIHPCAFISSV